VWAEPADCDVCASPVARDPDIAAMLDAPAEDASFPLTFPATHAHHPLPLYCCAMYI